MSPIISVVTATYNSEGYIDEALQSVLLQRGDFSISYIVVDNFSSDKTLSILDKYKKDIDSGVMKCNCNGVTFDYISEVDEGMYDALRKGISILDGDIFSYINSDDFYFPNAFATVSRIFQDKKINWLTGLPSIDNEHGAIAPANIPCVFKSRYIRSGVYGKYLPHIQQESTFWRSDLCEELDKNELASYKYAGDFYIWRTFSLKHKLYTVKSQLSGFRFHSANMPSDVSSYNEEFLSIVDSTLGVVDFIRIYAFKLLYKSFGNKRLMFFLMLSSPIDAEKQELFMC